MYNLLIALAVGILVAVGVKLAGFPLWAGLIPGVIALIAVYFVLARRIASKVQVLVQEAQKELSTQFTSVRERDQRVKKAISLLEQGLIYDKWQFLIGPEIHAQIGMIKYMVKDLEGADAHLAQAHDRNYMARALQGALYFQRKDTSKMEQAFEAAVRSGKKDPVVWAVYAWCLMQQKEKERAQKVLARGVDANPSDEKLKASLTALQNDKKLKMKAYEPQWWQFGLEQPPMQVQGGRQVRFQRT